MQNHDKIQKNMALLMKIITNQIIKIIKYNFKNRNLMIHKLNF